MTATTSGNGFNEVGRSNRPRAIYWYVQFKDEGHGFDKKINIDRQREIEITFMRHLLGVEGSAAN